MRTKESIKNRSLSQREIDKMNAMAGLADREEAPQKAEPVPAPKTKAEATPNNPKTITGLVRYYDMEFNTKPHLVVSAIIMEAAALIGKAIRDSK